MTHTNSFIIFPYSLHRQPRFIQTQHTVIDSIVVHTQLICLRFAVSLLFNSTLAMEGTLLSLIQVTA